MDMGTTNEPVAWMHPETLECGHGGNVDWEDTGCIPLYTHPHSEESVKVKELTDEEINEIFRTTWLDLQDYMDFARAILRKAQEK
jgi:hypothetical protein